MVALTIPLTLEECTRSPQSPPAYCLRNCSKLSYWHLLLAPGDLILHAIFIWHCLYINFINRSYYLYFVYMEITMQFFLSFKLSNMFVYVFRVAYLYWPLLHIPNHSRSISKYILPSILESSTTCSWKINSMITYFISLSSSTFFISKCLVKAISETKL